MLSAGAEPKTTGRSGTRILLSPRVYGLGFGSQRRPRLRVRFGRIFQSSWKYRSNSGYHASKRNAEPGGANPLPDATRPTWNRFTFPSMSLMWLCSRGRSFVLMQLVVTDELQRPGSWNTVGSTAPPRK